MENPSSSADDKVASDIRKFGWHSLHVFSNEADELPFSYSIGFTQTYAAPEVLIFNVERTKAHKLLWACAHVLKDGGMLTPDAKDDRILNNDYQVIFKTLRVSAYGEYLGTARRYYGSKPFPAVVMFLPDREDRYPWEAGYDYIDVAEALSIV
ncbi:MAG: DUF4262 domain-containing protein [Rudaea sp.]|nr:MULTISPECIES: DUF4262 domain-containing protein [unclassified Rudaea]MBN8884974.1 DUF4262 domain-containing protein [Rudaea sp.]MBR0344861.1 DUF4262 domain-containing protein [Rudaea sp.]